MHATGTLVIAIPITSAVSMQRRDAGLHVSEDITRRQISISAFAQC
jgi:hypothetical protein